MLHLEKAKKCLKTFRDLDMAHENGANELNYPA